MRDFSEVFELVSGTTIDEAIKEFEGSTLLGFRISDLSVTGQRAAFGFTLARLCKVERENHELRLADIPRQVETMRPKASRITRAMRALFDY